MAKSIEDKIFKKELSIEKLQEQIKEKEVKLSEEKQELAKLKEERDFQKLLKVKEVFNSEEDVMKFFNAVENKDVDGIKLLLNKN